MLDGDSILTGTAGGGLQLWQLQPVPSEGPHVMNALGNYVPPPPEGWELELSAELEAHDGDVTCLQAIPAAAERMRLEQEAAGQRSRASMMQCLGLRQQTVVNAQEVLRSMVGKVANILAPCRHMANI